MNLAIVNTLPIPSGAASVNRLLSYSKGLVEVGDNVTVLSSASSEKRDGTIDGVSYYNYGRGKGALSLIGSLISVIRKIWSNKYNAVILVSNSLLLIYPLVIACKIKGVKIIQEKSEFPFVLLRKSLIGQLWAKFYVSTTYRLFDGLIVMTRPLKEYFLDKVRKGCKIIEVPMTVDLQRFEIEKKHSVEFGDYIAYCGDMAGNKDGVANLIDAFSIAKRNLKDTKLLLIGGSSDHTEFEKLKQMAHDKCADGIVFYGKASREDIPRLLKNARALALARPLSLQSTGGFPTKLGEYLSTGNPVIVTAVGDIPHYLNTENSFIVQPDDNQAFADKIIAVFQDYEKAQRIGQAGRKVCLETFNYQVQAPRIHKFLEELCE